MVDVVARTAEQVFIPLTVGGGVRTRRGHARDAARRRRQGRRSTRPPCADPSSSRAAPRVRHAVRRRSRSTRSAHDGSGWEVYTHGGRTSDRASTPSSGRREVEQLGAGEILLTSMDADGTRMGYDLELTARRLGRRGDPGHRLGGRRRGRRTCTTPLPRARPTPCWRRRSSIRYLPDRRREAVPGRAGVPVAADRRRMLRRWRRRRITRRRGRPAA